MRWVCMADNACDVRQSPDRETVLAPAFVQGEASFMVEHQSILFGPPGTSKSHRARAEKALALGVDKARIVPLTFHPDYSYGEFVARLLPTTNKSGQIEYHVHAGPFIRALAMAFAYQLQDSAGQVPKNVVLLLDEINRGNCAEIFGDVFQLLDRDESGWSSYEISVSELVLCAFKAELERVLGHSWPYPELTDKLQTCLELRQLCLPPNLHMIGTMNTSDESIFFMDSAFKRRWHFEFCAEGFAQVPAEQRDALMPWGRGLTWQTFVNALNRFIRERCTAPRLDDKLVGPWFVKARCRIDKQTLLQAHPAHLAALEASASKFGDMISGVPESRAFDEQHRLLAEELSETDKQRLLKHGGYDKSAELKFTAIRSGSGVANDYYCSNRSRKKYKSDDTGLIVEDYLQTLSVFEVGIASYHIERTDIVGKLFFYLWDNVFDRDKSPLCNLLDLKHQELRTFGQFADQAEQFVERLCAGPVEATVPPGEKAASAPAKENSSAEEV
ncbi:ATPase associated with various cellular activitie [Pseudomonas coronafaciens pv. atropurpurea]|nr:ATPase associated with various cellular activitie [Pseudomonas coronafaciens pv. atropurpurea]